MAISARRTPLLLACSLGAVAVVAAACGSSGHSVTATPSIDGNHVTVIETEFHIALPQTAYSPGSYTFTVVNAGKVTHSLTITGPGVNAVGKTIAPGGSSDLTVSLPAGSYDVFCPIGSHKSLGMNQEITVGGTGSPGGAASTGTTTLPSSPTTALPSSSTTALATSPTTAFAPSPATVPAPSPATVPAPSPATVPAPPPATVPPTSPTTAPSGGGVSY